MSATALWAAVVASYDLDGLISLTNIRDRSAEAINTAVGENAAQGVIDLWPVYAQEHYDPANPAHVEVAKRATIAMLWARGGTAQAIAEVEWDEVFSDGGLVARVRGTGPRARMAPQTNSGVRMDREDKYGRQIKGWSDVDSLPRGILPSRRLSGQ